jgi:glutamate synthase (NADPH/NADH) large chain
MDVHHFAVLIGVGATVVNAHLAEEVILQRHKKGLLGKLSPVQCLANFKDAASNGILKIMSKMGISVVSSYRGGCNFEAIGLSRALVSEFFLGLPSRISGLGLEGIENRVLALHHKAFDAAAEPLPIGGFYRYRAREEIHAYQGELIHMLQSAVGKGSYQTFKKYTDAVRNMPPVNLRDLLDFNPDRSSIEVDQVESITEIRKRFIAPAMSLGALSPEAHETLAIAMNRMGAASNSGEGGEGPERYQPRANGDNPNSTIKQIASARFGVTAEYLNSAAELQIKVAQGAKPGEGGQLPAFKVTLEIARLRHATPGVSLISPPPHHDIYSIEDLAQLIYDLKQINPRALVSVKLVAQSGIGTIASGVAKAMADKIVIAGHTGGTGASPYSSIKHAGIPWEMGLAEANQVLTLNRMRHRVKLQTDGGLKTGRDIVIAALLGAEEYALGTSALVAMGCIYVRQCHSNTCPVGITTQDPKLRAKFDGTVEKVVNLFSFIAEEVREILASLGYKTLDEIIGRSDLLRQVGYGSDDLVDLDLNPLLAVADSGLNARYCTLQGRNEVPDTLDAQMIKDAHKALEHGEKIQLAYTIRNTQRAIGTRLSSTIISRFNTSELQPDHITIRLRGSAGQSLGAFAVRGLKIEVLGDANDYVGKGLSGGTITIRTRPSSKLIPHENTIIGNTVLYGATSGKLFAAGQAGERFAVRNSGASVVVEGCGSNGCEYMTGGTAVILGRVGDNFAAGMTGGMAFVYDDGFDFVPRVNPETVIFQRIASSHWENVLKSLLEEHVRETASPRAESILSGWEFELPKFWQICPKEMVERLEHPLSDTQKAEKRA